MPLRSTGCFSCRKRKIRCDEGRPGCRRCATHGIPCPGYRGDKNGGVLEFKDQTDVTVERAKGMFKRGRGGGVVVKGGKGLGGRVGNVGGGGGHSPTSSPAWTILSTGQGEEWTTLISPEAALEALTPSSVPMISVEKDFSFMDPSTHLPNSVSIPTNANLDILLPTPLPSPALEHASLYQSFITTYLPRKSLRNVQEGHFHFFQTLAHQRSSHPALQHGFDALSLVQTGSVYHDTALLQQATKHYALSLRALGRSIAKGDFLHDDEVLAAVVVLSSCELYEGIQVQGQGWSNHVAGANQLVAARGPASLQSDLALLLYANMRHGTHIHALIERKAPFMARKEWRDVAWRVPLKKDQSTLFYEWAIQVPGLLERHDQLDLGSDTALEELDTLMQDSADIEREMREWFAGWEAIASHAFGGLAELVPITEFPTFIGLCDDDAFKMALRFPDFLIGYLQTVYWMTMHFLRTNTQSLHKKRHQLLRDWYPAPEEEVQEKELMEYILNLCQSIPFFCEPESSSSGSVAIFLPMRTAAVYFTAHGHWRLLKWIGCVRNNVFVKGLKPPGVNGKLSRGRISPNSCSPRSSLDG